VCTVRRKRLSERDARWWGVSQHIGILRGAGLLDERRVGAKRLYAINGANFGELVEYAETFWRSRLRRLKHAAETMERRKRSK
jgi:DNA-binding transcriptional ArsR family regulator